MVIFLKTEIVCGISHLWQRPPWDWTTTEVDQVLDVFAQEDIAFEVKVRLSPPEIQELLQESYCRQCGKCCLPNPLNPSYPGVEIFEDELKSIAKHYHIPYKSLRKQTRTGKKFTNPNQPNEIASTTWMALPCRFFNPKEKQCQVYDFRPFVCKTYPVILTENDGLVAIKVGCDYGKDLCRSFIAGLKRQVQNRFGPVT